jgi:hypothetical protein
VYVFIAFAWLFAQAGGPDFEGRSGCFPEVQEVFNMKALFFLIVLALVATVVIWRVRKSDAEADLVRKKATVLRNKQRKEAIAVEDHVKWPVIVKPISGKNPSEEEAEIHEPSMTTIEFKPGEHATLQN